MTRVATPRAAGRRSEILAGALSCIAEVGVDAATIGMIGKRSGASVGSMYHHFGDKAGIVAALWSEGIKSYQDGLVCIIDSDGSAADVVGGFVRYHLAWIEEHPDWAQFLFHHVSAQPEPQGDVVNRLLLEKLAEWLGWHADHRHLVRMPVGVFLAVVLGPSQELSRRWLADRSMFDLSELAPVLAASAQRAAGAWEGQ